MDRSASVVSQRLPVVLQAKRNISTADASRGGKPFKIYLRNPVGLTHTRVLPFTLQERDRTEEKVKGNRVTPLAVTPGRASHR